MRAYLILHNANTATLITETFQCDTEAWPEEHAGLLPVIEEAWLKHASAWVFGEQVLLRATYLPARAPRDGELPRLRPARLRVGSVCYGSLHAPAIEAEIERLERIADYGRQVALGHFTSALTRAKNAMLARQLSQRGSHERKDEGSLDQEAEKMPIPAGRCL